MSQEERNSGAQTHGKHQRKKRGAYPGGLEARAQQNQETNGETPDSAPAPAAAPAAPSYGSYPAPSAPASDFAMLEDDDAQLPF